MDQHLAILLIVIPLIAAPLCVLIRQRSLVYAVVLAVCFATFAISVQLLFQVVDGDVISYELGGWAPPWGIEYRVDTLNAFVLLFVSGIGALVALYAPLSIEREIPRNRHYLFYTEYLLCLCGLLGITVTGDLFNVFVFLEISSLSAYALISLGKSRRSLTAAFQYLIMGTIGATFILIGIGLMYMMTGTLNMVDMAERLKETVEIDGRSLVVNETRTVLVAFAFLTVGIGIKMALFPLHMWLPNAYTYAPSVVTTFLAATATKVSVYILLRFVFSVFGLKFAFEMHPLDVPLMFLAMLGIFVASTAAIFQTNVKRLLAYSSIAQIGYMLLGISMANSSGLSAGIVHMFNHAIIKCGLFMVVGCLVYRLGSAQLTDLRGAGKTMPWTSFAWVIGGLGLIGVPMTAGFVSKWMLLTAALESDRWPIAVLMLASSLLAVVYVWRVVETLYFAEPSEKAKEAKEAPLRMLLPTYIAIVATVVFGCWTVYSAQIAQNAADALTVVVESGGTP